jgi:hypothetical protein
MGIGSNVTTDFRGRRFRIPAVATGTPYCDSRTRPLKGGAVAPTAAPTGKPTVAARSLSAPPSRGRGPLCHGSERPAPARLSFRSRPLGSPEARRAGGPGGGAPRLLVCRPNLDTGSGSSRRIKPLRPALFHAVQLSRREYQNQAAAAIVDLARTTTSKGKRRRNWAKKAKQLRLCGTQFHGECCQCGYVKGYIEVGCDLRICSCCARRRSRKLAADLVDKTSHLALSHGLGLYLITFTVVYDPASQVDLAVDGIRLRCERLLGAVQYCWRRYLRTLGTESSAPGLLRKAEVSPRGAVHCHALFYGRRPNIAPLRMLYMTKAPGSTFVNIKYLKSGKDRERSIKEVAKYITKGASPAGLDILRGGVGEYLDPVLAARVEFALSGKRLFEAQGCFRGMDIGDSDDDEIGGDNSRCPKCGESDEWAPIHCSLDSFIKVAPLDWKPVFARTSQSGSGPAG